MKNLNLLEIEETLSMYEIQEIMAGSCNMSQTADRFLTTAGLVAGVGSFFGPVGMAIFGPTTIGISVIYAVCAYR